MIRWRIPRYRGGRMRMTTKLQITAAVTVGFILGYLLLQSPLSPKRGDEDRVLFNPQFNAKPRAPGIQISPDGKDFIVHGKKTRILSGAMHYFRIVPDYWEDRMKRLKAAGLNTVETYVAWNAHEPIPGQFDFTGILDIRDYILIAQHLGLNVIVRPGPYICAEWEMGGLPAWLLRDPNMVLRSNYPPYVDAVKRYFTKIFEILVPLQSAYGGPIIGFQVENEYVQHANATAGAKHMKLLYNLMRRMGVLEMLFTSDSQYSIDDALKQKPHPDVVHTLNFQHAQEKTFDALRSKQPNKPLMVMEFWTGWFDHWGKRHLERNINAAEFSTAVRHILDEGSSINLYMFHGGTNFGFMNGANWGDNGMYEPTVSSYDYDAPLSECGAVTAKYVKLRDILSEMVPDSMPQPVLPPLPPPPTVVGYGVIKMTLFTPLLSTLQFVPDPYASDVPIPMEYLPINRRSGQAYGYVLYRTFIPKTASSITIHGLRDHGVVLLDLLPAKEIGYFKSFRFVLPRVQIEGILLRQLDILVENSGRVNFAHPLNVRKGINGPVEVDGRQHKNWKIYSFEFKKDYVHDIDVGGMWQRTPAAINAGPTLFKTSFTISSTPHDTFLDMRGWGKGVVFINGANIGRYWRKGPPGTLYVPAPLLKKGVNKVMIFEFIAPSSSQAVLFRDTPVVDIHQERDM